MHQILWVDNFSKLTLMNEYESLLVDDDVVVVVHWVRTFHRYHWFVWSKIPTQPHSIPIIIVQICCLSLNRWYEIVNDNRIDTIYLLLFVFVGLLCFGELGEGDCCFLCFLKLFFFLLFLIESFVSSVTRDTHDISWFAFPWCRLRFLYKYIDEINVQYYRNTSNVVFVLWQFDDVYGVFPKKRTYK